MNGIHPIHLREVELHRTLKKNNDNSLVTDPGITQSLIEKNIGVLWDLVPKNLESIRVIHYLPICWCTLTKVFPKDHLLYPFQSYLYLDE